MVLPERDAFTFLLVIKLEVEEACKVTKHITKTELLKKALDNFDKLVKEFHDLFHFITILSASVKSTDLFMCILNHKYCIIVC